VELLLLLFSGPFFLSGILRSSGHYVAGMLNIRRGGCPSISRRCTYSPGSRRNAVLLLLQPARCCDRPIPLRCLILVRYSQFRVCWPVLVLVETTLPVLSRVSPYRCPSTRPEISESSPSVLLVKNRCPCLSKVSLST
jgi:hypothetical protein